MVKKKESGGAYYSSGEFARMAQITVRTVRYYDKQNILKPSLVTPTGARFYTEEDFARLQQIMLLKYLGFSLEDIRELTVNDSDYSYLEHSLEQQQNLVRDRIEQLQLVEQAIGETGTEVREEPYAGIDPFDGHGKQSQGAVSQLDQYIGKDPITSSIFQQ